MTTNKSITSGRYNFMEGRFDMTQIPRLNENTGDPKLDALNKRCNENSERVEDLWIELDLQLIEAIEAEKNVQWREYQAMRSEYFAARALEV